MINVFDQFVHATSNKEYEHLHRVIKQGGYSCFSQLLTELRTFLTHCDVGGLERAKQFIAKGKVIVPNPQNLSPSWYKIWEDYERIIKYKEAAFQTVPIEDRAGEWQIIMDNPFTNEGITVYPALTFVEAAYLFAYFRKDLHNNEYIRLQKVTHLVIVNGNENDH